MLNKNLINQISNDINYARSLGFSLELISPEYDVEEYGVILTYSFSKFTDIGTLIKYKRSYFCDFLTLAVLDEVHEVLGCNKGDAFCSISPYGFCYDEFLDDDEIAFVKKMSKLIYDRFSKKTNMCEFIRLFEN